VSTIVLDKYDRDTRKKFTVNEKIVPMSSTSQKIRIPDRPVARLQLDNDNYI